MVSTMEQRKVLVLSLLLIVSDFPVLEAAYSVQRRSTANNKRINSSEESVPKWIHDGIESASEERTHLRVNRNQESREVAQTVEYSHPQQTPHAIKAQFDARNKLIAQAGNKHSRWGPGEVDRSIRMVANSVHKNEAHVEESLEKADQEVLEGPSQEVSHSLSPEMDANANISSEESPKRQIDVRASLLSRFQKDERRQTRDTDHRSSSKIFEGKTETTTRSVVHPSDAGEQVAQVEETDEEEHPETPLFMEEKSPEENKNDNKADIRASLMARFGQQQPTQKTTNSPRERKEVLEIRQSFADTAHDVFASRADAFRNAPQQPTQVSRPPRNVVTYKKSLGYSQSNINNNNNFEIAAAPAGTRRRLWNAPSPVAADVPTTAEPSSRSGLNDSDESVESQLDTNPLCETDTEENRYMDDGASSNKTNAGVGTLPQKKEIEQKQSAPSKKFRGNIKETSKTAVPKIRSKISSKNASNNHRGDDLSSGVDSGIENCDAFARRSMAFGSASPIKSDQNSYLLDKNPGQSFKAPAKRLSPSVRGTRRAESTPREEYAADNESELNSKHGRVDIGDLRSMKNETTTSQSSHDVFASRSTAFGTASPVKTDRSSYVLNDKPGQTSALPVKRRQPRSRPSTKNGFTSRKDAFRKAKMTKQSTAQIHRLNPLTPATPRPASPVDSVQISSPSTPLGMKGSSRRMSGAVSANPADTIAHHTLRRSVKSAALNEAPFAPAKGRNTRQVGSSVQPTSNDDSNRMNVSNVPVIKRNRNPPKLDIPEPQKRTDANATRETTLKAGSSEAVLGSFVSRTKAFQKAQVSKNANPGQVLGSVSLHSVTKRTKPSRQATSISSTPIKTLSSEGSVSVRPGARSGGSARRAVPQPSLRSRQNWWDSAYPSEMESSKHSVCGTKTASPVRIKQSGHSETSMVSPPIAPRRKSVNILDVGFEIATGSARHLSDLSTDQVKSPSLGDPLSAHAFVVISKKRQTTSQLNDHGAELKTDSGSKPLEIKTKDDGKKNFAPTTPRNTGTAYNKTGSLKKKRERRLPPRTRPPKVPVHRHRQNISTPPPSMCSSDSLLLQIPVTRHSSSRRRVKAIPIDSPEEKLKVPRTIDKSSERTPKPVSKSNSDADQSSNRMSSGEKLGSSVDWLDSPEEKVKDLRTIESSEMTPQSASKSNSDTVKSSDRMSSGERSKPNHRVSLHTKQRTLSQGEKMSTPSALMTAQMAAFDSTSSKASDTYVGSLVYGDRELMVV